MEIQVCIFKNIYKEKNQNAKEKRPFSSVSNINVWTKNSSSVVSTAIIVGGGGGDAPCGFVVISAHMQSVQ